MARVYSETRGDCLSFFPTNGQIINGGKNTFERLLRCPAWLIADLADGKFIWPILTDHKDAVFSARALVDMAKKDIR